MSALATARTLDDIARCHARVRADKVALIFQAARVSYGELDRRIDQAANGLIAEGVTAGERVAYLGKNSLCYFELLLALARIGAVMMPVNWRLAPPERLAIVADAGARLVFATEEFASALSTPAGAGLTIRSLADYEDWLAAQPARYEAAPREGTSDVLQLYTSGTSGRPKGVRLSHAALLAGRARDLDPSGPEWNRWHETDVSLIAMPCFHIGGTGFGLNTLYAGATGIVMAQFDAARQLDILLEQGVTKHFVVPSALRTMLKDPRLANTALPALKYIHYGASPIALPLMQQGIDVLGCGFVQKYGMTETSGTCVALAPEDHTVPANPRMRSVGRPLAGVEVRILGADGAEVPAGADGEIAIRSATNMSGYWRQEAATRATLLPGGWLRTGDVGRLDADGYLYLMDRLKDMIVSGGENVYSAEVEAALLQHPAIREVAVIGVPDERWGEAVKACVVLKDGRPAEAAAIIEDCRSRIAGFKTPKSVDFLPDLPRNAAGKVLKQKLREPYWRGLTRAVN